MSSYPTDKIEEIEELVIISSISSIASNLNDLIFENFIPNFPTNYIRSIEEDLEDCDITR